MKAVQSIFPTSGSELVRVTFVPFHGVNAEVGILEEGAFVPMEEEQFAFVDHPELRQMYTAQGWNKAVVTDFVFALTSDVARDAVEDQTSDEDIERVEVALFNSYLKSL